MAGKKGGFGPIQIAGKVAKAGLQIGGGAYGIAETLRIAKQKQGLLNQQKNFFFNVEQPLQQKQNYVTNSKFVADLQSDGNDILNQYDIGLIAEEGARLRTEITAEDITRKLEFQAQQNQIDNERNAGIAQGALAIGSAFL